MGFVQDASAVAASFSDRACVRCAARSVVRELAGAFECLDRARSQSTALRACGLVDAAHVIWFDRARAEWMALCVCLIVPVQDHPAGAAREFLHESAARSALLTNC